MATKGDVDNDNDNDNDNSNRDEIIASSDLSSFIREKDGTFRMELTIGKLDSSPSAIKKFALFRLGSDLYECRNNVLPMISAEPLNEDTNLWEWHANLVGPPSSSYEDICFHFKIKIAHNYPTAAPKIEICSYFEHPNVFGKWICLDMLQGQWVPDDKKQSHKDIGYGWTPAYTMQSILVQLQAFLFDAVDTTIWAEITDKYCYTSTTQRAREQAKLFVCNGCEHTGKKPWPEPKCWRDRLRFMVPGKEMPDVAATKQEFWTFLESINSLVTNNEWPRIIPLECGSFFSWTLLPWYQREYISLKTIKNEKGIKSMHKRDCKVIRGLINRCIKYLNQKPKPPPNKGMMLQKMYLIESAVDIAVNNTYSTKNKLRERGYWQWIKKDDSDNHNNDDNDDEDDDKNKEEKQWKNFPLNISQQIEALYCRWQSDLRRPGQLVEILSNTASKKKKKKAINDTKNTKNSKNTKNVGKKQDKSSKKKEDKKDKKENKEDLENNIFSNGRKYGIITKPMGYHWHVLRRNDLSEDEKKAKYAPYSKHDNRVRVMEINPLRTKQEKVMSWMNGPHYITGKRTWSKYKIESSKNNKRKYTDYRYKECMILDRFLDNYGKWLIVVHPMPERSDINKRSVLINIDRLKIRSEGRYYKAYVCGDDNKHYIINIESFKCRCIEDSIIYKIRRCIKKRTTSELWKEILIESNCDNVDVPWKEEKKEEITAWQWNKNGDKLDPIKYIGKCGFIDLSFDNLAEPYYSDDDIDNDNDNKILIKKEKEFEKEKIKSIDKISEIEFPEIGEKVIGRVVKIIRYGIFIDIGYSENGKEIHGFLHLSQIKCPASIINDKLMDYLQFKKDELIQCKEYEEYLIKEAKKKKKKRKKRAAQRKKGIIFEKEEKEKELIFIPEKPEKNRKTKKI